MSSSESPVSRRASSRTTLAGLLAHRGYHTVGVAANLYLREALGVQRGFQQYRIPRPVPILTPEGWYLLRRGMRRALSRFTDTAQFDRLYSRSEDVNEAVFSLLDDRSLQSGPFFVFANYMDSHFPYVTPAPFDRLFPGKDWALTQDDLSEMQERIIHRQPARGSDRVHAISQYDGGLAYDDAQIGRVLDWLKRRGLYDDTLIIVASDHGEAFGEKNLVLHANSVYQNLVHVALLIKFPHGAHAGVVNAPVSLIDVAPTVLTALGYPVPHEMQGRDLLANEAAPRRLYTESFPCPALHPPDCPGDGCMQRAVVSWPYKLIVSSSGRRELHDLSADPDETRDLYREQPEIAKKLISQLDLRIGTMPPAMRQQHRLGTEALQQLKSLGYAQ